MDKEEFSISYRESEQILKDFKYQMKKTLWYKETLELGGYSDHFKKGTIEFIDEKIAKYSSRKLTNGSESNRHICNICGRNFVGRGYTEKSTGLWVLMQAPYQSFVCSQTCGAVHTERQVKRYGF